MTIQSKILTSAAGRAALAGVLALGVAAGSAGAASAQENILGCSAPGGKQATGALIGAALGALAGNSLSKGDATGAVLGALAGGAAGSWVGCKSQRDEAEARYAGYSQARDTLVRHPAAYRRAVADQQRRDREAAERRAWPARYAAPQPYGYGYGYGYGGYDR